MNKTELAKQLEITTRQLRYLASRGMPTDSLKAAQAWRSSHLDITQTKNHRIDGNPGKGQRKSRKPEAKKAEAEVVQKAEVHDSKLDPYDDFLFNLLTDARTEIVAGLMVQSGLSFHDASIAFNEVGGCLAEIRERQGYKTTFEDVPNPVDHRLPDEVRAQIKTEIEERARELELLREEEL
jgi:hypothetical protein